VELAAYADDTGKNKVTVKTMTQLKLTTNGGERMRERCAVWRTFYSAASANVLIAVDSAFAQSGTAEHSITTAELPQDLSPWGMFLHADSIVKAVMIGLAFASLITWTVWIAKNLELRSARGAPA
jgi:hypothetical protein